MRIALVIYALDYGGAARVMTMMANYWAAKGWEVSLLTLAGDSDLPFYHLDRRVNRVPLGLAESSSNRFAGLANNVRRVGGLRRALRECRPHAAISFLDEINILTILAARGMKFPVIVSPRSDLFMCPLGAAWKGLRTIAYPMADRIVVHTERNAEFFSAGLRGRTAVIPNPILPFAPISSESPPPLKKPFIAASGRLARQKGFDLLIGAFAGLADRHPEWRLLIMGEGPLRPELSALCDRLKLGDRVRLIGAVKDPNAILKQADMFVFSSRYEGFGNALVEAMACGLPVISADCRSGPREIIRDGVDGLLVEPESVDALRDGMSRLIADEPLRRRLAARAPEVVERFNLEKIMGMWESILPAPSFSHG